MIWLPGILSQGGDGLPPKGKALDDYTWEEIRLISDAGKASEYFSVGDRKNVILDGTVGSLPLYGLSQFCYIIGIDHNAAIEGTNRIHFQFGFNQRNYGKPLAFIDSGYDNSKTSGSWFNMNNSKSTRGGWNSSRMRTVICPAFKSAMPSDLQAVLKTVTKYTDNTGGGGGAASYVTATTDDIFLLSEHEVFGTGRYGNNAEKNYQAQYACYSGGSGRVRLQHSDTGSDATWWLRSARSSNSTDFCCVDTSGIANSSNANYSLGFAPAFCV